MQRTEFNKRSRTTDEAGTKMKHKHKWYKTYEWEKCLRCGLLRRGYGKIDKLCWFKLEGIFELDFDRMPECDEVIMRKALK